MATSTYEERSLLGTLGADVFVYAHFQLWATRHGNSLLLIAQSLLALIAIQIVMQSVIAAATRNRLKDERDELIRLRGYRAGYLAFVSFTVVGLLLLWAHALLGPLHTERMAIHFLSVMFGMLVMADIIRIVTQLIDYRRAL